MTATRRALESNELLEAILCHLPAVQIPMVMRTCSAWNSVITTSKRIQEARVIAPLKTDPQSLRDPVRYRIEHPDGLPQLIAVTAW